MKDQTRNLNPHAEALLYSWIFGSEYSKFGGGVMDFWDKASDSQKNNIKVNLDRLMETKRES
jgi:hypothetical protein